MKTVQKLRILVLALGLMLWPTELASAVPMGTGFTYQGRLIDANSAADGLYDLQFKLFDDPNVILGKQVGTAIQLSELDVIDGYFTVALDFGSGIFDGNAVWLEVGVRPGELNDPNEYTILRPRQELTPTPYALYAVSTGGEVPLNLSGSDPNAIIRATNTGRGAGIIAETSGTYGYGGYFTGTGRFGGGVLGWAPNDSAGWGGWFQADGSLGQAVHGIATATSGANYGGYFEAEGTTGRGVHGVASNNTGPYLNYGGYFEAKGGEGRGVYGLASGFSGIGVYGEATLGRGTGVYGNAGGSGTGVHGNAGGSGMGVRGSAPNIHRDVNYGGYFTAAGSSGMGVYGAASNDGDYQNYGGYFEAAGEKARGVYAEAGDDGNVENYGGYFVAMGGKGRAVYALAGGDGTAENYGGYFVAAGSNARAVYGKAINRGRYLNYGGYFVANGQTGRGVYAMGYIAVQGLAMGSDGIGVSGMSEYIGVKGYANGPDGTGVQGYGKKYDFLASGPGQDYGHISSVRWKNDVRLISDPLEKVMGLRGVYFNWDAEHGGHHDVGMVAEEVGQILPEIVSYEENGVDATGMDYSKLTPLLVEAIKSLKNEADERQKKLAEKDTQIVELKARLVALEARVGKLTVSKEGGGL